MTDPDAEADENVRMDKRVCECSREYFTRSANPQPKCKPCRMRYDSSIRKFESEHK